MSPILSLAVVLAGGAGAVIRYSVSVFVASRHHESWFRRFPWAVFIVNVAGSGIAGLAAGLASVAVLSTDVQLVIITGFAGGLTTFSTFGVETVEFARLGRWRTATLSCLLNLGTGLVAGFGGYLLMHALFA